LPHDHSDAVAVQDEAPHHLGLLTGDRRPPHECSIHGALAPDPGVPAPRLVGVAEHLPLALQQLGRRVPPLAS
jgi:hypothetical protein